jgi:hypothetical protein
MNTTGHTEVAGLVRPRSVPHERRAPSRAQMDSQQSVAEVPGEPGDRRGFGYHHPADSAGRAGFGSHTRAGFTTQRSGRKQPPDPCDLTVDGTQLRAGPSRRGNLAECNGRPTAFAASSRLTEPDSPAT